MVSLSAVEFFANLLAASGVFLAFVVTLGIMGPGGIFVGRVFPVWLLTVMLLILMPQMSVLALNQFSFLGDRVLVDRDRALALVSEASSHEVSDFSCLQDCGKMTATCKHSIEKALSAAQDSRKSQEIKALAGMSD